MILQHKTSNKVYNLIGIENNGLELTLKLSYWHKTPKGYRKSTRSTSVYSWEALIEQMQKFEELGIGEIKATDVKKWLNELETNEWVFRTGNQGTSGAHPQSRTRKPNTQGENRRARKTAQ